MSIYGFNMYELLYMYRQGDERSLKWILYEVRPLVKTQLGEMTRKYPPLETYFDDLMQEAFIMISYALDTFRDDGDSKLLTYVMLILNRRMLQQAKRLCTSKNVQLHKTISIDKEVKGRHQLQEIYPDRQCWHDPEFMLAYNNAKDRLDNTVQEMNAADFYVMNAWASGQSYKEGCNALHVSYKSYDGRLQRVKKKIHKGVYQEG